MELAKSCATIDRTLFSRRSSWLEWVAASFRGLYDRLQARMWRGECEARLRALVSKGRQGEAKRTPTAVANPADL